MTCDHDLDQAHHAVECPECQQQLSFLQKLRSRMAPPPSPLGADFARRTAEAVLRQSLVAARADSLRRHTQGNWYERLTDNPLVHIVRRQRNRHMFRLPRLAAVLLAFLVPGSFVMAAGDVESIAAYFTTIRLGLTIVLPLFLLSLELATLTALVRGRCLEEILHTGMEPRNVCDTLAANGLRALLPATLLVLLAILPLQSTEVGALQVFGWLPLSLVAYGSSCYLSQAHLLVASWPRLASFLGVAAVACALGGPAPYNVLAVVVLLPLAAWARRACCQTLQTMQSGRLACAPPRVRSAWTRAIARRLPDDALLQRELLRHPHLGFTRWSVVFALAAAALLIGGYDSLGEPILWMSIPGLASMFLAQNLVSREKETGTYDVLVHSGLRPHDWLQSATRLNALRLLPLTGGMAVAFAWVNRNDSIPPLLGIGVFCALIVSVWAGSVAGVWAGITQSGRRGALGEGFKQIAIAGLYGLVGMALLQAVIGEYSVLASPGSFWRTYAMTGVLTLTATLLAGYARARQLRNRLVATTPAQPCWLLGCLAIVPALLLYATESRGDGWFATAALWWTLVLCWALRPTELDLLRQPDSVGRKLRLTFLSLATGGGVVGLTFWSAWACVLLRLNTASGVLPSFWADVDYVQIFVVLLLWTMTWMLLGERNGWFVPLAAAPGRRFNKRPLAVFSLLLLPAALVIAQLRQLESWLHFAPPQPETRHERKWVLRRGGQAVATAAWAPVAAYLYPSTPDFLQWDSSLLLTNLDEDYSGRLLEDYLKRHREAADDLAGLVEDKLKALLLRIRFSTAFAARDRRGMLLSLEELRRNALRHAAEGQRPLAERRALDYFAMAFVGIRAGRFGTGELDQILGDLSALSAVAEGQDKTLADERRNSFMQFLPESYRQSPGSRARPFQAVTLLDKYVLAQANQFAFHHPNAQSYLHDNWPWNGVGEPFQWELWNVQRKRHELTSKRELLEAAVYLAATVERQRLVHGTYPDQLPSRYHDIRVLYKRAGASYGLKLRHLGSDMHPTQLLYTRGDGYKIIKEE